MKKLHLVAALLSVAYLGYAGTANAGIAGTPHDLTGGAGQTTQICVYCHTPHGSGTPNAPLWNRINATVTYTMYSSPTLDGTIQTSPQGVSLACLSCHDGATSFDSLVNPPSDGTLRTGLVTGPKAVGKNGDLSNDHPISITYGVGGDFVAAVGGKVGTLPLYGTNANQVECGSCHDPHDNATHTKFLRLSLANSGLCTTCHQK